jgi:tetratricopeptide (TPR) repeat protein
VLACAHRSAQPSTIAAAQLELGVALIEAKEYHSALPIVLEARSAFRAMGYRPPEVASLGALADLWGARGKHRRALVYRRRALALATESLDHQGRAEAWRNLADQLLDGFAVLHDLYRAAGRPDEARAVLGRSRRIG